MVFPFQAQRPSWSAGTPGSAQLALPPLVSPLTPRVALSHGSTGLVMLPSAQNLCFNEHWENAQFSQQRQCWQTLKVLFCCQTPQEAHPHPHIHIQMLTRAKEAMCSVLFCKLPMAAERHMTESGKLGGESRNGSDSV